MEYIFPSTVVLGNDFTMTVALFCMIAVLEEVFSIFQQFFNSFTALLPSCFLVGGKDYWSCR